MPSPLFFALGIFFVAKDQFIQITGRELQLHGLTSKTHIGQYMYWGKKYVPKVELREKNFICFILVHKAVL